MKSSLNTQTVKSRFGNNFAANTPLISLTVLHWKTHIMLESSCHLSATGVSEWQKIHIYIIPEYWQCSISQMLKRLTC